MGMARPAPCRMGVTSPSAQEDQGNGADVDELPAGGLPRAVPRGYVRDFVRHHAGQLGFCIGFQDQGRSSQRTPPGSAKAFTSSESSTLMVNGTIGVPSSGTRF